MFRRSRDLPPVESTVDTSVAQSLVDSIKCSFTGAEIPIGDSIDFCIRPKRELQRIDDELRQIYGFGKIGREVIPRTNPMIQRTTEATALYYGSSRFLERQSHRFIFYDDDRISYHKEPFDIDCQAIGSRTVNLAGLEAITNNAQAMEELQTLARMLEDCQPTDWACRPDMGRVAIKHC